jgi:hypothetical protein
MKIGDSPGAKPALGLRTIRTRCFLAREPDAAGGVLPHETSSSEGCFPTRSTPKCRFPRPGPEFEFELHGPRRDVGGLPVLLIRRQRHTGAWIREPTRIDFIGQSREVEDQGVDSVPLAR